MKLREKANALLDGGVNALAKVEQMGRWMYVSIAVAIIALCVSIGALVGRYAN